MKDNVNILLLDRFMRGETSAEEERILLDWFRSDVAYDKIQDLYRSRWQESKESELDEEVLERMLQQTKARIRMTTPVRRDIQVGFWFKYVAAIILFVGLGLSFYFFTYQSEEVEKRAFIVEADKGQRSNITLPDGTKVWLNSHTQLSYLTDYGQDERIVTLNGEAYFEVAKDKERRFVVKTDIMDVEALGTSFNVKAYKIDNRLTTTLFEGSVRVSACDKSVVLSPNQELQLSRADRQMKVNTLDNSHYANMWRDNELAFNKETLRI